MGIEKPSVRNRYDVVVTSTLSDAEAEFIFETQARTFAGDLYTSPIPVALTAPEWDALCGSSEVAFMLFWPCELSASQRTPETLAGFSIIALDPSVAPWVSPPYASRFNADGDACYLLMIIHLTSHPSFPVEMLNALYLTLSHFGKKKMLFDSDPERFSQWQKLTEKLYRRYREEASTSEVATYTYAVINLEGKALASPPSAIIVRS